MVPILGTFFLIQLPLNENENNVDGKWNDINYNRTVMKLHDAGWENSFSNSADFSMISYGYGVSQYPQFYYQYLDKYQVLPRPYWGCFEGYPGEKS